MADSNNKGSWLQTLFRRPAQVTSEEHLQELIHASEEDGIINAAEGEMFSSIIEFGDMIVREVMIPRTEMHCCTVDASLETIIDTIIRYGHTRIPVYEDTIDHIVGVVYAKDLLKYWNSPPIPSPCVRLCASRFLCRKPSGWRNCCASFVSSASISPSPLMNTAVPPG